MKPKFGEDITHDHLPTTSQCEVFSLNPDDLEKMRKNDLDVDHKLILKSTNGNDSITVSARDEVQINPMNEKSLILPVFGSKGSEDKDVIIFSRTGKKRFNDDLTTRQCFLGPEQETICFSD